MPTLNEYRDKLYNDDFIEGQNRIITTWKRDSLGKIQIIKTVIPIAIEIDENELVPSQGFGLDDWQSLSYVTKK